MKKVLFSVIILTMIVSALSFYNIAPVVAAKDDEKVNIDHGDKVQDRIRSNERIRYRFREKTKVTIESDVPANVSIKCDAKGIGDKDFEIEIESEREFNLTMNCKEEKHMIGLRKGNTYEARNRYRYRYQEGFVAEIESTEDVEAKLRIKETEENRGGTWAYYDEAKEEWVPVETTSKNGYLECETDHFSIWTVLVPEIDYTLIIMISSIVGAIVLGALVVLYLRRRNHNN
ncbi:MAG: hypothetical protein GF383_10655 [Candidatus Lokiarchaeota archaeon]|nr:hypothetical protein [Candidatus Lokiarchaeota archaeon]MBD3341033.1 hypothetical protein [Candidatus Lokiarchaeota archaeon]